MDQILSTTDTGNDGMAYRVYGCGIKAMGHEYDRRTSIIM